MWQYSEAMGKGVVCVAIFRSYRGRQRGMCVATFRSIEAVLQQKWRKQEKRRLLSFIRELYLHLQTICRSFPHETEKKAGVFHVSLPSAVTVTTL